MKYLLLLQKKSTDVESSDELRKKEGNTAHKWEVNSGVFWYKVNITVDKNKNKGETIYVFTNDRTLHRTIYTLPDLLIYRI